MGTRHVDVKGEIRVAETIRVRVPKQHTGTEPLVVVMKPL